LSTQSAPSVLPASAQRLDDLFLLDDHGDEVQFGDVMSGPRFRLREVASSMLCVQA